MLFQHLHIITRIIKQENIKAEDEQKRINLVVIRKVGKHQKCFYYKFVTVILFGTMPESFRKIVPIVFELRALVLGWQGCGTQASIFFIVLIYRYLFIKTKKSLE